MTDNELKVKNDKRSIEHRKPKEKSYEQPQYLKDLDILDEIENIVQEKDINQRRKFQAYSFSEMMALPPKTWFIDSIFGDGDYLTIVAQPNVGKTFVALDLAFSVCLNKNWAGFQNTSYRPLKVLFCMAEGFSGFKERLVAAQLHYGAQLEEIEPYLRIVPNVIEAGNIESVVEFVREHKDFCPDVIFFDTLADVSAGLNENLSTDITKVYVAYKFIQDHFNNCAIVSIHHTGKDGATARGSGVHIGKASTLIMLSESDGVKRMDCIKAKDSLKFSSLGFTLSAIKDSSSVFVSWEEVKLKKGDKKKIITDLVVQFLATQKLPATAKLIFESIRLPSGVDRPTANNYSSFLDDSRIIKERKNNTTWLYRYNRTTEEALETFVDSYQDDQNEWIVRTPV